MNKGCGCVGLAEVGKGPSTVGGGEVHMAEEIVLKKRRNKVVQ